MKKQYITPVTEQVVAELASMIAASPNTNSLRGTVGVNNRFDTNGDLFLKDGTGNYVSGDYEITQESEFIQQTAKRGTWSDWDD